jgi:alkylation response protein AidB-like acyl-CoA dehydrogenase
VTEDLMPGTAVCDAMVHAARALRPTLLAQKDEAERLGRLHPKVVAAAGAAGMFRLLAPQRVGGLQMPLPVQYAVWQELAHTDSSVAWCSWNCGPAGYFSAFLPPKAAAVVHSDLDACFGWSGVSGAIAAPVAGGVEITGRWPVVSGAEVSAWFALSCRLGSRGNSDARVPGVVFVPAGVVEIHDTWRAGAFRATGSHAVSTTDAFVPDEYVWRPDLAPVVDEPLYHLGAGVLIAPALGAIALGLASGAFDEMRSLSRRTSASTRAAIRARTHVQEAAGDAAAVLGAAGRAHAAAAQALWDAAEQGCDTVPARAELWSATFLAVEATVTTIDRLHRAAGIDALADGGTLDRALREVHAIVSWLDAFRPLRAAAGRVVLGLDPDHVMF